MRTPSLLVVLTILAGCGAPGCGAPASDSRYPARADGCDVQVFHGPPSVMSDNIGPVTATCGGDVSDADCMRTLEDQVCKLGGDVVWGVPDSPTNVQGKKQFAGRAAHTKTAGK